MKDIISFEEESSHSDTLKNARKTLYRIINGAVNAAMKIKAKDFVELKQKQEFYKIYNDKYSDIVDELDDDDIDILSEEWDDVIDPEFDNQLEEIIEKNRKSTNWVKPPPKLEKLQKDYTRFMKKYDDSSRQDASMYQAALRMKKLILKHYKASDVPNKVDGKIPEIKPK